MAPQKNRNSDGPGMVDQNSIAHFHREEWQTVSLSKKLMVLRGGANPENPVEDIRSLCFLDLLDEKERDRFKIIAQQAEAGSISSGCFSLADGKVLEILIVFKEDAYDLYYRRTEQGFQPLERISLLYRNFLTSSEAVVFTDPQGTIVDVNQAFLDLYGYELNEVAGKNPRFLSSGRQSFQFYREMWARLTDKDIGTWSGEITNHKKNREEVTVLLTINSIRNASGTVIGYIGHTIDVTERKRMEEALARAKEEWECTFHAVPDLISILDTQHRIVRVNKAMADKLGLRPEEVVGRSCYRCVHGLNAPVPTCPHSQLLIDGRQHIVELYEERLGGYYLVSISPLHDLEGKLIGSVHVARDITERKLVEDALQKKDQELEAQNRELERLNSLKSDLMAITSHDLKSPLSAMVGYANLMRDHICDMSQEKITRYLDRIAESGERLMHFINELLDLEKIESGNFQLAPQLVRLDEVLESCIVTNSIVAGNKKIPIHFHMEGTPGLISVDPAGMEQVFNNILSNAVKFSPEGSHIDVTYRDEGQNSVRISVCDQGPGIPPDELETIFERYYQVSKKGSVHQRTFGVGLGLAIVKNLVQLHQGTVSVENRPEGGCCFILAIPYNGSQKREGS